MLHALTALTTIVGAATTPTPTPTPSPTMQVDPDLVTPGVVGFLVTAFVAVAVIFLVWDMMRRIRRGRVRADIQEQLDAEAAQTMQDAQAARAVEASDTDDDNAAADDEPPAKA